MTIQLAAQIHRVKGQRKRAAGQRQLNKRTVLPPMDGWNSRRGFNYNRGSRREALELINLIPSPHGVHVREGITNVATVTTGTKQIFKYASGGVEVLLTATKSIIEAWVDGPGNSTGLVTASGFLVAAAKSGVQSVVIATNVRSSIFMIAPFKRFERTQSALVKYAHVHTNESSALPPTRDSV